MADSPCTLTVVLSVAEVSLAPLILGLIYATVVGHLVIRPVTDNSWSRLVSANLIEANERDQSSHPAMVGYLERTLFALSWIAGRPELGAVWLVLKAAASWHRWTAERAVFNVFLIGTGLSVLIGYAGGVISSEASIGHWGEAGAAALLPVILAVLFRLADSRWLRWLFR